MGAWPSELRTNLGTESGQQRNHPVAAPGCGTRFPVSKSHLRPIDAETDSEPELASPLTFSDGLELLFGVDWAGEMKRAAFAWRGIDLELPADGPTDSLADGEAQAEPSGCSCVGGIEGAERLKEVMELIGGDPRA